MCVFIELCLAAQPVPDILIHFIMDRYCMCVEANFLSLKVGLVILY